MGAIINQYKSHGDFQFPKHDIDPKEKDGKEWNLKMAKAIFARYVSDNTGIKYSDRSKFELQRLYAEGRQPIEKYRLWFEGEKQKNETISKSLVYLDEKIFSPATKYMAYIKERAKAMTTRPRVRSVDKMSGMEKQEKEANAIFYMKEGPWVEKIEEAIGAKMKRPEFIPKSERELEIFKNVSGGFKSTAEIAYTFALSYTEIISKFPEIADRMMDDILTTNACVCKDYVSMVDGKVYQKYIDIGTFVGLWKRESGFSESPIFGHFEDMTLQQVLQETNIPEEELKNIQEMYSGYKGNLTWGESKSNVLNDDQTFGIDDMKVCVFISEGLTTNDYYKIRYESRKGRVRYFDQPYGEIKNSETKQTEITKVQMLYQSKWIIGSDQIWNFGKMFDQARPGKKKPKSSYHAYKLTGQPFIDVITPSLDQIELAHIKMQNALAKAAPDGLAIDYGVLQNVTLGDKTQKPIDLIRLRNAQGYMIYQSTTHKGVYTPGGAKPITPITGGAGKMFEEALRTMEIEFQFISETSGINRQSIGVLPNSGETSATASANAANGSDYVIKYLTSALNYVREDAALSVVHRIALRVKHSKMSYDMYDPSLGSANLKILKLSADFTPDDMGIEMKAVPDSQMMSNISQAAIDALRAGKDGVPGIDFTDYIFIMDQAKEGNLEYASAYLEMRKNENIKRAHQMSLENIDRQAEGNAKVSMATSKADQEKEQTKADMSIKVNKAFEEEKRITVVLQEKEKRKTEKMKIDSGAGRAIGEKIVDHQIQKDIQQSQVAETA